jgi:hypothetical protein
MVGLKMLPDRVPQHGTAVEPMPRSVEDVQSEERLAHTSALSFPLKPASVTLNWSVMSSMQSA